METFPAHLRIKAGYTMVELATVLGVAAILLTMGLYGYRGFEYKAQLRGTQRALMNHLKMARNDALSGVLRGGTTPTHYAAISSGDSYIVDGQTYNLTSVEVVSSNADTLCFFHPQQEVDPADPVAAGCINNCISFACAGGGAVGSPIIIRLRHRQLGGADMDRCLQIDGSGLKVNRIYEVNCP